MKRNSGNKMAIVFMLPAIILLLAVYLIPFCFSIGISLTDWNGISKEMNFVGIDNYMEAFKETNFLQVLKNTFVYFVEIVVVQNIIGLGLALMINNKCKGRNFFRAVLFMPTVICTIAVSFIWNIMLNPSGGPITVFLEKIGSGLADLLWLGTSETALHTISAINIWQWAGWTMLIYFVGLQSIDQSLYESSSIDGASGFKQFTKITLPMLAPSITINIINTTIGTLKIFDLPYVLTKGGPGHYSESISISIYSNCFMNKRMGYGSALSIILFVLIFVVSAIQLHILLKKEDDMS